MRLERKKSLIRNESVPERGFESPRKSFFRSFHHFLCSLLSNSDSNANESAGQ
jgi:hypothetical protein